MQENLFYIFSIYTIAYLKSIGISPVKIEKSDKSNKVMYWYENNEDLKEALNDYNNDWKIQSFINSYKLIKEEMFNM